jgi:hypothetical protein
VATAVGTIVIDAGELVAWSEIVEGVAYAVVRSSEGDSILRVRTR